MGYSNLEYINSYNKKTYKMFQFRINIKKHQNILQYINIIKNKNEYILDLIEKDFRKNEILTIREIKDRIVPVLYKYDIYEIYLFGSYSKGLASYKSDVDIYCEKGNIKTLIDKSKLRLELENVLNKEVDLIFIHEDMNSILKNSIERDIIKLC